MFVDAFTIAFTVVWVYARWNIHFALHLRQFIPYGHFHPFSCLNFSRLMKGLNIYNDVTEWDNWFVCVAVETYDLWKENFLFIFGPGYFSMRPRYFSILLLWRMVFFYWKSIDAPGFFRHFIFGKVWLLLFNMILNILIVFQNTCKYMYQWVWV